MSRTTTKYKPRTKPAKDVKIQGKYTSDIAISKQRTNPPTDAKKSV